MPIVIEQPQPLAPGISAGYGGAEVGQQMLPHLQQQQQAMVGQVQHAGDQLAHWYSQMAQQAQQSDMARFQLGANLLQQQAHTQAQAQLQDFEMTRSEQMRMARLQAQEAAVMASPYYTDQEKEQARIQIRTGLDPLKQKAQQFQLAQQQSEFQEQQRQARNRSALENMSADDRAQHLNNQVVRLTGPDGQYTGMLGIYDPLSGRTTFQQDHGYLQNIESRNNQNQARMEMIQQQQELRHQDTMNRMEQQRSMFDFRMEQMKSQLELRQQGQQAAQENRNQRLPSGVLNEAGWLRARHQAENDFRREVAARYPNPTDETAPYGNIAQFQDVTYQRNIGERLRQRNLENYADYLRNNPLMRGHPALEQLAQAAQQQSSQGGPAQQTAAAVQDATGGGS